MYSLCNCEFKTLVSVFMMKENLFIGTRQMANFVCKTLLKMMKQLIGDLSLISHLELFKDIDGRWITPLMS